MYSIGGVAGARNPANAECFISQSATLYENGFLQAVKMRHLQHIIC